MDAIAKTNAVLLPTCQPNAAKSNYSSHSNHRRKNPNLVAETTAIYENLVNRSDKLDEEERAKQSIIDNNHSLGEPLACLENRYLFTITELGLGVINVKKAKTELFANAVKSDDFPVKSLLFPLMVTLTEVQINKLEKHLDDLSKLGFDLYLAGPTTFTVRKIPLCLEDIDINAFFQNLLEQNLTHWEKVWQQTALRYLIPIKDKSAQQKFLLNLQHQLSEAQREICFQCITADQLDKLI